MHKMAEYRRYPNVRRKFVTMGAYNFSGVIVAFDGCHVSIETPSQNANSYYNRKEISLNNTAGRWTLPYLGDALHTPYRDTGHLNR